ncbi:MAG: hypothetical protein FJ241_11800 [Nitrospira sp.]|nr:hypothetical protein [Nitrospira sp.]
MNKVKRMHKTEISLRGEAIDHYYWRGEKMKSEKLTGVYEGLKLALKIIRNSKELKDAHYTIEQHLMFLNETPRNDAKEYWASGQ